MHYDCGDVVRVPSVAASRVARSADVLAAGRPHVALDDWGRALDTRVWNCRTGRLLEDEALEADAMARLAAKRRALAGEPAPPPADEPSESEEETDGETAAPEPEEAPEEELEDELDAPMSARDGLAKGARFGAPTGRVLLQLVRVIAHGDAALAAAERAHLADVRASVARAQWDAWVRYAERWLAAQRRGRSRAQRCQCGDPSCAWHSRHPVEHAIATIAARVKEVEQAGGAAEPLLPGGRGGGAPGAGDELLRLLDDAAAGKPGGAVDAATISGAAAASVGATPVATARLEPLVCPPATGPRAPKPAAGARD